MRGGSVRKYLSQVSSEALRAFRRPRAFIQVQECTAGGGVYKVKLDASGCFSHVFWMTPLQVGLEECVPTLNGVRTSTPPAG